MRGARPLDWKDNAWPRVFAGEMEGKRAAAVFNYSENGWGWSLDTLGLGAPVVERLHPLGCLDGNLSLGPHDAALVVEV